MAMGCDFGQGDLIAPPMSRGHFLDLLRRHVGKPHPQPQATATSASPAPTDRVA
jgi:hypothetical protein